MKLIINTSNLSLTQKIKDLAHKHLAQKLDKYLTKFGQEIKVARLAIKKDSRWGFSANLRLGLPQRGEIFAKTRGESLLKILIEIRDQAERQIKEYKEKQINTRRN